MKKKGMQILFDCMQTTATTLVVLLFGYHQSAFAFQRSRADETKACVWWSDRIVPVYLDQRGSQDITLAELVSAIQNSLETWSKPGCSDFQFNYIGTTPRNDVGYDQSHPNNNINLITFVEDVWPHPGSGEGPGNMVVALTTITFDTCTGQIFDADLEMNGADHHFSTDGSGVNSFDVQNTVTHEAGHMLGLDHSTIPEATMYAYEDANETNKRELHIDDINGVCYVYPVDLSLPTCLGATLPSHCKPVCGCQACQHNLDSCVLLALLLLWVGYHKISLRSD